MVAVADTSVLVDHVNGRRVRAIEQALANEILILPPLVISELVTGAAHSEETRAIAELMLTVARHGVNLTIPDAHVAQCAIDLDATLITRDKIFQLVARHIPLRLADSLGAS